MTSRTRGPPLEWLEELIWGWLAVLLRAAWPLCRAALRLAALLLGLLWALAVLAARAALGGLSRGGAGRRQSRRRRGRRRDRRR